MCVYIYGKAKHGMVGGNFATGDNSVISGDGFIIMIILNFLIMGFDYIK